MSKPIKVTLDPIFEESLIDLAKLRSRIECREVKINEALMECIALGLPMALKYAMDSNKSAEEYINQVQELGEQLKNTTDNLDKGMVGRQLAGLVMEIFDIRKHNPALFTYDEEDKLRTILTGLSPHLNPVLPTSILVH